MPLVVPVEGRHVSASLASARSDSETFTRNELRWTAEFNPLFEGYVGRLFGLAIKEFGDHNARLLQAGALIGHQSVRRAIHENSLDYTIATSAFSKNELHEAAKLFAKKGQNELSWGDAKMLEAAYGEGDLNEAISAIKDDTARDATAFTIGMFCLDKLPEPIYATAEAGS